MYGSLVGVWRPDVRANILFTNLIPMRPVPVWPELIKPVEFAEITHEEAAGRIDRVSAFDTLTKCPKNVAGGTRGVRVHSEFVKVAPFAWPVEWIIGRTGYQDV